MKGVRTASSLEYKAGLSARGMPGLRGSGLQTRCIGITPGIDFMEWRVARLENEDECV